MYTFPELARELGPTSDDERWHCSIARATVDLCVSLRRFDDAFTLTEWLVDLYAPRFGDHARQAIWVASRLCRVTFLVPEVNARAITLLRRVIELSPREAGMEWAICTALMDLSTLYTFGWNVDNNRERTQASIGVCDEIIERWQSSGGARLRLNVAGAMINKAIGCTEIDEEPTARQTYARVGLPGRSQQEPLMLAVLSTSS